MKHYCSSALLLGAFFILLAGSVLAATINFDSATPGALPPGWTSAMTHRGGPPHWGLMKDATAPSQPNVLAQTSSDRTDGRFPLAIYKKTNVTNGSLSVQFKPISGVVDASGGLVWRYLDPNNYYVVRANADENNVVLYKVLKGRRSSISPVGKPPRTYGVKHLVAHRQWHTLAVSFHENLFTVTFDGEQLFQVKDNTFTAVGKVGLWTKADSVTYFDNFVVKTD